VPAFAAPEFLRYTREHEWVRLDGARAQVGITEYAQNALGDIVFVSLPEPGSTLTAGQPCGEVESTKSVSEIFAPLSGTVVAVNPVLEASPEVINSDPYGAGWMFAVEPVEAAQVDELLDAATYEDLLG